MQDLEEVRRLALVAVANRSKPGLRMRHGNPDPKGSRYDSLVPSRMSYVRAMTPRISFHERLARRCVCQAAQTILCGEMGLITRSVSSQVPSARLLDFNELQISERVALLPLQAPRIGDVQLLSNVGEMDKRHKLCR